tara:strand:+ start:3862 stop:4233 length:372 start_codon:yes stop_codon:yes gene_type:complete
MFDKLKIPVGIGAVILLQAFGIIWYVATLDSNVNQLTNTVQEMRDEMKEQGSVDSRLAVLESNVEIIMESGGSYDDSALIRKIEEIDETDKNINRGIAVINKKLIDIDKEIKTINTKIIKRTK